MSWEIVGTMATLASPIVVCMEERPRHWEEMVELAIALWTSTFLAWLDVVFHRHHPHPQLNTGRSRMRY